MRTEDRVAGGDPNPFAGRTCAAALEWLEARHGPREAIVFRDRRYTFADVRREVRRAAARLCTLGLAPGDRVALWLPNRPEFLWYWLGAAYAGFVAVFLNTRLRRDEFLYQIAQSGSVALVTAGDGAFRDFLGELAQACPGFPRQPAGALRLDALPALRHVVALDPAPGAGAGITDWSRAPGDAPCPAPAADPDAVALIAYSSGTTALPKGAMLSHCVWRKAWDGGMRFEAHDGDRLLLCVPLFGVLGFLSGILMFWTHGAAVVLEERFDADRALDLLERERCTCVHLLPAMIEQLLAHPRFGAADLHRLRAGIVLSNDPAVLRRAAERLGVRGASSGYGMTESTGLVTRGRLDEPLEVRLRSHGTPLPGCAIRVVDPDTHVDRAPGEVGEIWIGGYSVMKGYYDKPAETAAAITPDGWLRSGDAGYLNADGTLVFLHRLKDGYKHKGFNVSTLEVEAALLAHPAVAEAAVVPVPHPIHGECGVAFVVPRAGSAIDVDELDGFLAGRLASFKRPAEIRALDALPRTGGTEKVQKFRLRELALAGAR